MNIAIYNSQKDLSIDKGSVRLIALTLLKHLNIETDELIIHFVSAKKMSQVHAEHFNDPSSTDCMSFPLDPPHSSPSHTLPHVLGEIFACPQVAIESAEKHKWTAYDELTLYVIHGLLHLIGYDDLLPADRRKMRRKEKDCLKHLNGLRISEKKIV